MLSFIVRAYFCNFTHNSGMMIMLTRGLCANASSCLLFKNNLYIVSQPRGLIFPNCTILCAFNPACTSSQLPLKEVTGHTFYFELSQPAVSCGNDGLGNDLNSGVHAGWLDLPVACQGDLVPFLLPLPLLPPQGPGQLFSYGGAPHQVLPTGGAATYLQK